MFYQSNGDAFNPSCEPSFLKLANFDKIVFIAMCDFFPKTIYCTKWFPFRVFPVSISEQTCNEPEALRHCAIFFGITTFQGFFSQNCVFDNFSKKSVFRGQRALFRAFWVLAVSKNMLQATLGMFMSLFNF